jgi:HEAT repeat protein
VAALLAAALLTAFFLSSNGATDLDPAINTLAKLQIQDRWSHPEMLKIRAMGEKALPDLRVVLRERHHPAIKLRREAQKRFPKAAAKFGTVDDRHLRERVWVVCQAIQTLGATARPAAPELIELLAENDNTLLNGTTMALHAIGIDREITDRLDVLVEKNALGQWQKVFALRAMGRVTPPSDRSLAAIAKGLSDSSDQVQRASAEAAGTLGVSNAFIIAGLKFMQTNAVDDVVAIKACAALWKLTKDRELALRGVLPRLERRLSQPLDAHPRPGDSGQGISHGDQLFLDAAEMIRIMKLEDPDRTRARLLFENWGYKAGRIFVDMLLLPATFELGMPESKCLSICKEGLERKEDYYRIQAARLLATISERFTIDDELLKSLLADTDPNVRMYAAKIHWAKHRDASVVTPILAETLDRLKHHSYWYEHNVHIALETLRDIGPPARQAIPALEKASNDPNPKIVTLAQAALVRIRK